MNQVALAKLLEPITAELAEIRQRLRSVPPPTPAPVTTAAPKPAPAPSEPKTLKEFAATLDALSGDDRTKFYAAHSKKWFADPETFSELQSQLRAKREAEKTARTEARIKELEELLAKKP